MAAKKETKQKEAAKAKKKTKSTELEIDLPDGVTATLEGGTVKVKGPKGELMKTYPMTNMTLTKKDNKILLNTPSVRKFDKANLGATNAHIENMIRGVQNGVTYKMKIVYSHFPMNAKIQGDKMVIDNFLGEKYPRKARILKNVAVEVKGQDVTLKGIDIDTVSQTAANIEQITKIKGRDLRVFQDGIYITEKDGKPIK